MSLDEMEAKFEACKTNAKAILNTPKRNPSSNLPLNNLPQQANLYTPPTNYAITFQNLQGGNN
jgi:hypothetical protein